MPDCEILCIGTELLLGQILNTNAQFFSKELAGLGINCFHQTTVGDNQNRIIEALRAALNRTDIVLISGGLGPTPDDLTTECTAAALGVDLIFENSVLEGIENIFAKRGLTMPPSNKKQAFRPRGSMLLPNPRGTAPGIIWSIGRTLLTKAGIQNPERKRLIMTFPGVPSELQAMWQTTALPFLINAFGQTIFWSCELKHYGISESALAEKYASLLNLSNPTVAPYAGNGECRLRVTAHGDTQEAAMLIAEPIISNIKENSGQLCYGTNDETLESVVANQLKKKNLTISLAESCTGGLLSKRLTDIDGSSAYTKLNVVTYSNDAKATLLQVPQIVLDQEGAVSEKCALSMAQGIRKLGQADIGIAVTGIAGPTGGSADKPVGLVYVALNDKLGEKTLKLQFPSHLSRDEIRHRTASEALNMVRLRLQSS